MKCEWCGQDYPDGSGEIFYKLNLWADHTEEHIICIDCYKHLKRVRA